MRRTLALCCSANALVQLQPPLFPRAQTRIRATSPPSEHRRRFRRFRLRRRRVPERPKKAGRAWLTQEPLELAPPRASVADAREAALEEEFSNADRRLAVLLTLPPLVAFMVWPGLADGVSEALYTLNVGRAVDGNAFAVQLLRPTVNGVILPTLSIALGTLLATTINVLRNRQVEIRACLNKEACELRLLRAALLGAYGTAQHAARRAEALDLLRRYCARCVRESSVGAFAEVKRDERAGGVGSNELEPLGQALHGVAGAHAARQASVGHCWDLLASLNGHRSDRLAALLGGFPPVHWFVVAQLALSIVVAFLIESNQEVLQFLNALQLRVLFGLLIAVCSSTAALCFDLADPFRGRFSVVTATQQIARLEDLLSDDVDAARRVSRGASPRDAEDWHPADAARFHVLNSAYAAPARALGDVASYLNPARRRPRRRPSGG